jgi:hypothetical protein
MEGPDNPGLQSIRRLNRHVHDAIAKWLDGVIASFAIRVRPSIPAEYPPCRQDLYGFTACDIPATKPIAAARILQHPRRSSRKCT